MAAKAAFLCMAVAAVLLECALGATVTVGSPGGAWDQSTDLQTWAASQTFSAGDTLVFQYLPNHDVLEVSKSDYDACQASSPIKSYTGGSTTVPLPAPGKRYFICGSAGHCAQGMKLEVDIVSSAAAPEAPTAPAADAPTVADAPVADGPTAADFPAADAPTATDVPAADAPSTSITLHNTTTSPTPGRAFERAAPSAAAGTKASAAAGFASGLLVLLLVF